MANDRNRHSISGSALSGKSAFESSEYAKWKIDDVDMLERLDMETVYVIEVESGKQEFDLYYSAEGILIKNVADTDNDSGITFRPKSPQPSRTL